MANLFNSIRIRPPKYNRFDLSHDVKLTGKFGKLIPILCRPTLPGDVYKLSSEVLVRMAPMLAPIMTKVNVYTHFFFVPNRLLWDGWKDFITGGEDGESDEVYPRFEVDFNNSDAGLIELFQPGSLADYLGFPVPNYLKGEGQPYKGRKYTYDALPFRAYSLIWNEYYRDENLMKEIDIAKDLSGIMNISNTTSATPRSGKVLLLRDRSWAKDYFTSALPFAQRGDEVELPLQGDVPLYNSEFGTDEQGRNYATLTSLDMQVSKLRGNIGGTGHIVVDEQSHAGVYGSQTGQNLKMGSSESPFPGDDAQPGVRLQGIYADLSHASSATINELRRAIKAQEFLELAARGGSRYIEQIYSYFGVRSSDARLQRPEFLGGGKSPIMISDVLQTSQSTENSAQANPAGHGVSVQRSHSFKYRCEEHGYIIGILSVMPKAAYMQGMPRLYTKFDRLDYYWPQFAHLGEQEIKNSEIYYSFKNDIGDGSYLDGTFGYTPRYAEYKTMQDSVHGDFRNSLSFWHMARIFGAPPALNKEFLTNVEDAANRVFNVVDENVDKLWINIHHDFKALMKMPKYGTPYM